MKKDTIKPVKRNVFVRMDPREEVSKGGIVIPERSQETSLWGTVEAVGSEVKDLEEGDRVLIPSTAGTHIVYKGQDLILVEEQRIIAREENGRDIPA